MNGISKRAVALMLTALMAAMLWCGCAAPSAAPQDGDTAPTVATTTTTAITTTTKNATIDQLSSINIRSGAGFDYESIGTIQQGENFIVLSREGDWFKVQYGDIVGYVHAQYVDLEDQPNASEMEAALTTRATTTTAAPDPSGTTVSGQTTTTTRSFDTEHVPNDVVVG